MIRKSSQPFSSVSIGADAIEYGNPDFLLREPDERCLTGFEGERRAAEIEPDDPRRWCRRDDGLDGEDESVGERSLIQQRRG